MGREARLSISAICLLTALPRPEEDHPPPAALLRVNHPLRGGVSAGGAGAELSSRGGTAAGSSRASHGVSVPGERSRDWAGRVAGLSVLRPATSGRRSSAPPFFSLGQVSFWLRWTCARGGLPHRALQPPAASRSALAGSSLGGSGAPGARRQQPATAIYRLRRGPRRGGRGHRLSPSGSADKIICTSSARTAESLLYQGHCFSLVGKCFTKRLPAGDQFSCLGFRNKFLAEAKLQCNPLAVISRGPMEQEVVDCDTFPFSFCPEYCCSLLRLITFYHPKSYRSKIYQLSPCKPSAKTTRKSSSISNDAVTTTTNSYLPGP
ncbi:uncharacterized protein LOC125345637 [Perognathus longimembris pacificus]|uniref:uncharacterized protein LOC125345637 n=1 Tax=Perognathus longimembris pacificus TaxID=214514 RepID=UPI002019A764|nr:uncharacterized protein LOC125345637 [Perognathus longimembris pacificus]